MHESMAALFVCTSVVDGCTVATAYDVSTGDEVIRVELGERVKEVVLSPAVDGEYLAVITPEHLTIRTLPSLEVKSSMEWSVCNPTVAISADNQYIAVGGRNTAMWKSEAGGVLQLFSLDTLEAIYTNDSLDRPVDNVEFSRSSPAATTTKIILVAAQEHGLSFFSVPDMGMIRQIDDAVYSIRDLIFLSPETLIQANGKEITAFTSSTTTSSTTDSNHPVKIADDVTLHTSTLALSPDSTMLASSGDENSMRIFETASWGVLSEIKGSGEPIMKPHFADDHTLIVLVCTGDILDEETPSADVLVIDVRSGLITRRVSVGTARLAGVFHQRMHDIGLPLTHLLTYSLTHSLVAEAEAICLPSLII